MEETDALLKALFLPDTGIDQTPEPVDIIGEIFANARFNLGELSTLTISDSAWNQQVGPASDGDSLAKRATLPAIPRVEETANGSGDVCIKEFDSRGELIRVHIEAACGDTHEHLAKAHQQAADQSKGSRKTAANEEVLDRMALEKVCEMLDRKIANMNIRRPQLVNTTNVPVEFKHLLIMDED